MSVQRLVEVVARAVKARQQSTGQSVKYCMVSGKSIKVDGKLMPFDAAVDVSVKDGEWVYVMLSGSKAVIVGK